MYKQKDVAGAFVQDVNTMIFANLMKNNFWILKGESKMIDMIQIKSLLVSKAASKLIEKYVKKKTGHDISISLDDFVATYDGDSMKINVTAGINIDKKEFQQICSGVISG